MLPDGEREVMEITFDPNSERLKQGYLDIFEIDQILYLWINVMKILTYRQHT